MRWVQAIFGMARGQRPAQRLYAAVVRLARRPDWYIQGQAPDTVDGRFDVLALVLAVVLRRLDQLPAAAALTRSLLECFVDDMDNSLREIGVGDLSVGKQVKAMVDALNGRRLAYGAALDQYDRGPAEGAGALAEALQRNLFRGADVPSTALDWLGARVVALAAAMALLDAVALGGGPALDDILAP